MRTASLVTISALAVTAPAAANATTWEIDPVHTSVGFHVRHLMITTVQGRFKGVRGTVEMDDKSPEKLAINVEIDAASIDTANEKRDGHLRSADFFDVANHPKITFVSKSVKGGGKNKYKVTGDLTIRGVTKSVTLDVTVTGDAKTPDGKPVRAAAAAAKVNRTDFGLKWNVPIEGGILVGEDVTLAIDVELGKRA